MEQQDIIFNPLKAVFTEGKKERHFIFLPLSRKLTYEMQHVYIPKCNLALHENNLLLRHLIKGQMGDLASVSEIMKRLCMYITCISIMLHGICNAI